MLSRHSGVWICITLLGAMLSLSRVYADPIDARMRQEDPRLLTPVTIAAPRIYIGELLERLSAQTGVKLAMPGREVESGIQVAAFLDKTPLADALDSIWSLVSYQHAEYALTRDKDKDTFRYTLSPTPRTKELAAALRQQVWDAYRQEAATMLAAAKMSPQERKKVADKNPRLAEAIAFQPLLNGLNTFTDSLTPEQQQQVLRGEQKFRLPVSQLSPAGQAFVKDLTQGVTTRTRRSNGNGTFTDETKAGADWVEFSTSAASNRIYPSLWLNFAGMSMNYLGSTNMEQDMISKFALQWLLPGDSSSAKPEDRRTGKPEEADPKYLTLNSIPADTPRGRRVAENAEKRRTELRRLEIRLEQLAHAAPLSLLARLPLPISEQRSLVNFPAPYGQPLKSYLQQLGKSAYVPHKWRDGVLLLSVMDWFAFQDGYAPYASVQAFRVAATANKGFLPLATLAFAADTLTPAQLIYLGDEFPTLAALVRSQPLLAIANHHREMLSPTGYVIGDDAQTREAIAQAAKNSGNIPIYNSLQQHPLISIRVEDKPYLEDPQLNLHILSIIATDDEKKQTTLTGFPIVKWEPDKTSVLP